MYEGGIRIPFLMQWKGKIPPHTIDSHPVMSTVLMATFTTAAGAPLPKTKLDSVDLIPYIPQQEETAPHEFLFGLSGKNARFEWETGKPYWNRDALALPTGNSTISTTISEKRTIWQKRSPMS